MEELEFASTQTILDWEAKGKSLVHSLEAMSSASSRDQTIVSSDSDPRWDAMLDGISLMILV